MSVSAWLDRSILLLAAAAAVGCGEPYNPGTTESSGTASSTGTGTSATGMLTEDSGVQTVTSVTQTSTGEPETGEGTSSGSGSSSSSTGEPFDCAGAVAPLAASISAGEPCEVVLQLGDDGAPLGWSAVCGATGTTWNSGKAVVAATACCSTGASIYGPDTDAGPVYVVHQSTAKPYGVAIVSNHTGRVVFDATTAGDAPGPVTVPESWMDAAGLAAGEGCGDPGFSLADAWTFDLENEGEPMAAADLDAVAAAAGDTALTAALAEASSPVRTVIVRYAPQDGGPAHTIVLFEVTGA